MLIRVYLFLCCLQLCYAAGAQDKVPVKFGKVEKEDFLVNSPLITENSNAVIIAEVGSVKFEGNSKGWFTYVYKVKRRIRILKHTGFDIADVNIYLYRSGEAEEKAEDITAASYTLENDKIITTKLSTDNIYTEKTDKNHTKKKFTVPGIKEGSIIEYGYTIKSEFEFNLPSWDFQSVSAPTLWSEYTVSIPGMLDYMMVRQGYHRFFIDAATEGHANYTIRRQKEGLAYGGGSEDVLSVSSPTIEQRWVMKDLPALTVEEYMFCPGNFIDKISLQLYRTYDGQNYHDVANNWKKVADNLLNSEEFGLPVQNPAGYIEREVENIKFENDDKLQTAQKIYNYVRQKYTCTNRYNKYIKTSLNDVINKKTGSVGDINLLLAAMLKQKEIDVSPVLLSTRSFGYNSVSYPLMEKLNYTICKARIAGNDYYLDATEPFLAFGKLPLGHARVIAADTMPVYFVSDSLNEDRVTSVFITNGAGSQVQGTLKEQPGFFESLRIKERIAASGLNSYIDRMKNENNGEVLIEKIAVDSFNSVEEPVGITADFKVKAFGSADVVYFNPMMNHGVKKNPFYAAERLYPVEMPYKISDVFVFNMDMPDGYAIEELPKSTMVKLNDDDGFFEYMISAADNKVQMRCRLVIKRTVFGSDDYQTLRDFYAFIVKKEAEQIVFKKIK